MRFPAWSWDSCGVSSNQPMLRCEKYSAQRRAVLAQCRSGIVGCGWVRNSAFLRRSVWCASRERPFELGLSECCWLVLRNEASGTFSLRNSLAVPRHKSLKKAPPWGHPRRFKVRPVLLPRSCGGASSWSADWPLSQNTVNPTAICGEPTAVRCDWPTAFVLCESMRGTEVAN